jgi:hypothetical protein
VHVRPRQVEVTGSRKEKIARRTSVGSWSRKHVAGVAAGMISIV